MKGSTMTKRPNVFQRIGKAISTLFRGTKEHAAPRAQFFPEIQRSYARTSAKRNFGNGVPRKAEKRMRRARTYGGAAERMLTKAAARRMENKKGVSHVY